MTTLSLTQFIDDLNEYINSHDELDTKLRQADSLACFGENADFDLYSKATIRYYLLTLTEIMESAVQLSEHLSQELCRLSARLKEEKPQSQQAAVPSVGTEVG